MATLEMIDARNAAEKQLKRERLLAARRDAAAAGKHHWLDYPMTRREAKRTGAEFYFTGVRCRDCGKVAPRRTTTEGCQSCADLLRERPRKTKAQEKFELLAMMIETSGFYHGMSSGWAIRRKDRPVDPAGVRDACMEAAKKVDKTGRFHVVIYRGGKWLVREKRAT